MASFVAAYKRFFSIEEIVQQSILQWMFGASLLFFFLTFDNWIGHSTITVETAQQGAAICWPYFLNCSKLYFLHLIPYGYSQSILYMAIYAIMLLIVYYMWEKKWVYAHMLLTILFLWKVFVMFILSYSIAGPYDYYHVFLTAILLFIPLKEYFLKLAFVFFYFLSVTVKFDPTWILGTYFTAMKSGIPVFPGPLTPPFTNLVIFMQVIGSWFLLSKHRILQRLALLYALIFHLYSGILVYYLYPSITLPPLLILFGPMYRYSPTPFSRKAIAGWIVILLVALFQLLGFIIPTDRRLTLEGNRFGMFMFEANHQCIATVRTYSTGGLLATSSADVLSCQGFYCLTHTSSYRENGLTVKEDRYESPSAWNRCDPYEWWAQLHTRCAMNPAVVRVAFQFDHSINGGPFYRIVDVPNICDVIYRPFVHNDWILMPPEAQIVGYPVQNGYQY
jgi:hypothetical protein